MKRLIDISGKRFYHSMIDQVIEEYSSKGKCAIIIDENYLDEFSNNAGELIEKSVNQLIIISENLNEISLQIVKSNVLLVSVGDLEEAVRIAVLGAYNHEVIYVSEKDEKEFKRVIELIES